MMKAGSCSACRPLMSFLFILAVLLTCGGKTSIDDMARVSQNEDAPPPTPAGADVPPPVAQGAYYIATYGSDTNEGSASKPWATFEKAMSVLGPGDTLVVKDGTYNEPLSVTVSGIQGSPVTIRAENDGKAVIDGRFSEIPCRIHGSSTERIRYITVEGLVFRNSKAHVVDILYAEQVALKRVSAYNADYQSNSHVYSLLWSRYVLLEDCAASGYGRAMFNIYESDHAVLRRCWGKWVAHSGTGGDTGSIIQIYGSSFCIVENCVGTAAAGGTYPLDGIGAWANYYNTSANGNRIYGNVIYGPRISWTFYDSSSKYSISGNRFRDDVSIGSPYGFSQEGDNDLEAVNLTIAGASGISVWMQRNNYTPKADDFLMRGTLTNSSLVSGKLGIGINENVVSSDSFTHTYNNFHKIDTRYQRTSQGTGELAVDPLYDTATYGNGAYLMMPAGLRGKGENNADIGAEVLYCYKDGVLTNAKLWPWPMEDRIFAETGTSVTWEGQGGIWKTLKDAYQPKVLPRGEAKVK